MGKHETGYARVDRDYYPTPSWATLALLEHINIDGLDIWEPACGGGHMSEVLKAAGANVYSSDVTDRGYAGLDALIDYTAPPPAGLTFNGTITNPPFGKRGKLAVAFMRIGLRNMGDGFLALLLPCDFDSAKTRAPVFRDCPQFAGKIVLTRRCKWYDNGNKHGPKENSAWFLWGNVPLQPAQFTTAAIIRYAPTSIQTQQPAASL
jgi:hypothetical protein